MQRGKLVACNRGNPAAVLSWDQNVLGREGAYLAARSCSAFSVAVARAVRAWSSSSWARRLSCSTSSSRRAISLVYCPCWSRSWFRRVAWAPCFCSSSAFALQRQHVCGYEHLGVGFVVGGR